MGHELVVVVKGYGNADGMYLERAMVPGVICCVRLGGTTKTMTGLPNSTKQVMSHELAIITNRPLLSGWQ